MTPNEVKLVLLEVLGGGVFLNTFAFVIFVCGSFVAVALAAGAAAFFGKRGETAAMKRDIGTIKTMLAQTTAVTEEIKAKVSGELWLGQKRWERKWECYVEMVRSLGEIHTLIGESLALDPNNPDYANQRDERTRGVTEAFQKFRQFGSIARIAIGPNARTVLTRLGDEWNKSLGAAEHLGRVARWGWLVITDIARADLFGETREMSDEFIGDVEVPAP